MISEPQGTFENLHLQYLWLKVSKSCYCEKSHKNKQQDLRNEVSSKLFISFSHLECRIFIITTTKTSKLVESFKIESKITFVGSINSLWDAKVLFSAYPVPSVPSIFKFNSLSTSLVLIFTNCMSVSFVRGESSWAVSCPISLTLLNPTLSSWPKRAYYYLTLSPRFTWPGYNYP